MLALEQSWRRPSTPYWVSRYEEDVMKYAITGATGFVGNVLARQLIDQGNDVVATVRTPAKAAGLADLGARVTTADLDDVAGMTAAFRGCDGVFHVAGWYKVGDPHPDQGWKVNVEGTKNVIAADRGRGRSSAGLHQHLCRGKLRHRGSHG